MRPDKAKVINEIWDDARIAEFLHKAPLGQETAEHSKLLYAYRSMRPEDFERFVTAYVAQGGDVHAPNTAGQSLAEVISAHKKAAPFLEILNKV